MRVPAVGDHVPRVSEGHRLKHVAGENGDHHRDRQHDEHLIRVRGRGRVRLRLRLRLRLRVKVGFRVRVRVE